MEPLDPRLRALWEMGNMHRLVDDEDLTQLAIL